MVRTLYIFGMGLLALATAFLVDTSRASAGGPWAGCYVGGLGSYNAAVLEDTLGAEGPGIAATIGCDAQSDRFVFGAWTEYGWRTFDWAGTDVDVNGWAAGGRAGYLVTPSTLLYGLVGYTDLDTSSPLDVDLSGALVGGGSEVTLGNGLFARAEYQYLMLEPDDGDEEFNAHSARLGLVWKFNGPDITAPFEGTKPLK